jgi:hypothetical protein
LNIPDGQVRPFWVDDGYNQNRIAHLRHTLPFRLDDNSWWLRSGSFDSNGDRNMVVRGDGIINIAGEMHRIGVSGYIYHGVRPAMWVTL